MRNVLYHFTGNIPIHIFQLEGEFICNRADGIVVFDDAKSFSLAIRSAKISVGTKALSAALNRGAFAAPNAPIKNLEVSTQGQSIKMKGKLHSKGDIPFETEGTLAVTPDGQVRIQTRKIKAVHLPVKGLMDLLGVELANLVNTKQVQGLRAEGDDLILDPARIFPPPEISGKLSAIQISGDQIVQIFGKPSSSPSLARINGNYMAYRGSLLRFGKLTMNDSDLILIDQDPRDPFDFFLDHYKDQLVAGYSKTTREDGLRVYMPDYNKLHRTRP